MFVANLLCSKRAVSGQGGPEVLGQLAAKVTTFLATFYKDEREWQGRKQHSYVGRCAVKRHCVLWRARSHSQLLACVGHVAAPRSLLRSAVLRTASFTQTTAHTTRCPCLTLHSLQGLLLPGSPLRSPASCLLTFTPPAHVYAACSRLRYRRCPAVAAQ